MSRVEAKDDTERALDLIAQAPAKWQKAAGRTAAGVWREPGADGDLWVRFVIPGRGFEGLWHKPGGEGSTDPWRKVGGIAGLDVAAREGDHRAVAADILEDVGRNAWELNPLSDPLDNIETGE